MREAAVEVDNREGGQPYPAVVERALDLILEAGGLVSDFDGEPGYLEHGHIVCGNPKVFGQLLKLVQGVHGKKARKPAA